MRTFRLRAGQAQQHSTLDTQLVAPELLAALATRIDARGHRDGMRAVGCVLTLDVPFQRVPNGAVVGTRRSASSMS